MSHCKQCGLDVEWKFQTGVKSKRDHWQCFNPDGSVHWDACSQARAEAIKRTGQPFHDELHDGYITPLKKSGIQFTRITAAKPTGRKVKTAGCDQCVPPWETCPQGCPIEFGRAA